MGVPLVQCAAPRCAIFSMLWTMVKSCHWAFTLRLPRRVSLWYSTSAWRACRKRRQRGELYRPAKHTVS